MRLPHAYAIVRSDAVPMYTSEENVRLGQAERQLADGMILSIDRSVDIDGVRYLLDTDGKLVATCSEHHVLISDVATGQLVSRLVGQTPISRIAFSPDGRTLAHSKSKAGAQLWDVETGVVGASFTGADEEKCKATAISPDGRSLLFTQRDYQGEDLMLVENFR